MRLALFKLHGMNVWKVFGCILCILLGSTGLFSQQYELFPTAYSTDRLVYKIPAAIAKNKSYADEDFLRKTVAVDTMSIYEDVQAYVAQLDYGHYVFVTVYRNELFFNYYQHAPFNISTLEDGDILRFRVFDHQNKELKNLAGVNHRQIVFYNYEEACYRFEKEFKWSEFSLINATDTFYYNKSGYPGEISKEKRRQWRNAEGLVLLNKPKYRHGDTLKMAAFLKRKNGTPYTKEVYAVLNTNRYANHESATLLGQLQPEKPGLYVFEMVISDTLKLDRNYYLHVGDKQNYRKGMDVYQRFLVEDYLLDESRSSVKIAQTNIGRDAPVDLVITSTDANGLALRGAMARVRIVPFDLTELTDSQLYLPIVWYDEEIPLSNSGLTKVHIEGTELPIGTVALTIETTLTNASNETESFTNYVRKSVENSDEPGDTLFKVVDQTRFLTLETQVPAFKGQKCTAYWLSLEHDTLHEKVTTTDANFKWVPNASELNLRFDESIAYKGVLHKETTISFAQLNALVFANMERSDSVCTFHLVNNRGLKVHYQLYEGGKELESGYVDGGNTWRLYSKDNKALTLRLSYEWAGKMTSLTKRAVLNTAALQVNVKAPNKSFPGNTERIDLNVRDYEGEPVAQADVIAYGVNSNFQTPAPSALTYQSPYKDVDFTAVSIKEQKEYASSRIARKEDIEYLKLDSQLFYHWMYPDSGYQVHPHLPSPITSFRIHAMNNGQRQTVRVVYVDDVPVYINGASTQQNIVIDTNPHTLRVRTERAEVTLKNVVCTQGKSNQIVFDISRMAPNMDVQPMKLKLKGKERRFLNSYLMNIRSFHEGLVSTGNQYWNLRRYGSHWIGPVAKGTVLTVAQQDVAPRDVNFEAYNDSLLTLRKVKLKRRNLLLSNQPTSGLSPIVLFSSYVAPPEKNSTTPSKEQQPTRNPYISPFERNGGAFLVEFPKDKDWEWELMNSDSSIWYQGAAGAEASLVLNSTIQPGTYLLKASCDMEERVYQLDVKKDLILHIDEHNEQEFLVSKKELQPTTKAMSGRFYDLRDGHYLNKTFYVSLVSDSQKESSLNRYRMDTAFSFHIHELNPAMYWVRSNTGDYLQAVDLRYGSVHGLQLVTHGTNRDRFYWITKELVYDTYSYRPESRFMSINTRYAEFYDLDYNAFRGNASLFGVKREKPIPEVSYHHQGRIYLDKKRISSSVDSTDVAAYLSGLYGVTLNGTENFVRSDFSDEAFWQPLLQTNGQGKVSFSATLPDDITRWNTYYYVFGPKRTAGFAQADINSYLPLSANLRAPRFLIEGDLSHVSLQTLNYTGATLQVAERMLFNGAVALETESEISEEKTTTQEVTAPMGASMAQASYSVASENGFKDGESRSIPVHKKGMEEHIGHFMQVSQAGTFSLDFDPALGDITVYAAPNPLPALRKALDGLKSYPHGCNEQLASRLMAYLIDEAVADANGSKANNSGTIKRMIEKLEKHQNDFGAWSWYGAEGNTSDWVTLHVVKALAKAREIGYAVTIDPVQFAGFISQQSSDLDKLRWMQTAKKELSSDLLSQELKAINYSKLNEYSKLLYLDLLKSVTTEDISNRLEALKKRTATGMHYYGSDKGRFYENNLVSTCLAFDLLLAEGQEEELAQAAAYLLYSQRNGDWSNTLQKAMILERLVPYYSAQGAEPMQPAALFVTTEQGLVEITRTMTLPAQSNLGFSMKGNTPLFLSAYQTSFNPSPALKNDLANISVQFMEKDQTLEQLNAGSPVLLECALEVKEKMEYCTLTLPIVAGCDYGDKIQGAYTSGLQEVHREYFRDKVVIYFEYIAPGSYTLKVHLEPRYSGSYTLNPSQLQLMYFPTLSANNVLQRVEIKP